MQTIPKSVAGSGAQYNTYHSVINSEQNFSAALEGTSPVFHGFFQA
jgi:hypothetical protein